MTEKPKQAQTPIPPMPPPNESESRMLITGYRDVFFPLVLYQAGKVESTGIGVLKFPVVPLRQLWTISSLAAVDDNNAGTKVQAILASFNGLDFLFDEMATPASGVLQVFRSTPIYLPEGLQLAVRFIGATSGDNIRVFANGYSITQNLRGA